MGQYFVGLGGFVFCWNPRPRNSCKKVLGSMCMAALRHCINMSRHEQFDTALIDHNARQCRYAGPGTPGHSTDLRYNSLECGRDQFKAVVSQWQNTYGSQGSHVCMQRGQCNWTFYVDQLDSGVLKIQSSPT